MTSWKKHATFCGFSMLIISFSAKKYMTTGFDTNTVPRSRGLQKLARDFYISKTKVPLGLQNFKEKHKHYEFYC